MKNTECNIIYIAITVYALLPGELAAAAAAAADGSSVGCHGGSAS